MSFLDPGKTPIVNGMSAGKNEIVPIVFLRIWQIWLDGWLKRSLRKIRPLIAYLP
ncbi:hypothetical protein [Fulvimarina sp. MAC8]|uniref:hypothetical protein n=1 Tax=Fulvimarina sp. MAC8 TaxID=3162874 RepID=UPI0032F0635B